MLPTMRMVWLAVRNSKENMGAATSTPRASNTFSLLKNPYRVTKLFSAFIQRKWKARENCSSNKEGRSADRRSAGGRQTRAVMNKALLYSLSFFSTYLFPITISIRTLLRYDSGYSLSFLARVFFPLQGFFNFVVFIHPKVMHAKNTNRSEGGITWTRAFIIVMTAREPRRDTDTKSSRVRDILKKVKKKICSRKRTENT